MANSNIPLPLHQAVTVDVTRQPLVRYSRSPRTIEQMLENMFVGRPPGNYDRILDFSTAVTGSLFFVPTATFLDSVSPDQAAPAGSSGAQELATASAPVEASASTAPSKDGSLGIGSLKKKNFRE